MNLDQTLDLDKDIGWSVFSKVEEGILRACYQNGDYYNLCSLPNVNIDTQEKEKEVEKMVLSLMPLSGNENESQVRQQLEEMWGNKKTIETPEEEAEWQAKIEEEERIKKEKRNKKLAENKKKIKGEDKDLKPDLSIQTAVDITTTQKKKCGRPKGSKNKTS